jgi:hypothetical protein
MYQFRCFQEKSAVNRKNRYGRNFKSQYCSCEKPYPPPEDDPLYGVDMYQCFMCEDWFHAEHIDAKDKLNNSDDYTEMCCPTCSSKYPFISTYQYVCDQEAQQHADVSNEVVPQSQVNFDANSNYLLTFSRTSRLMIQMQRPPVNLSNMSTMRAGSELRPTTPPQKVKPNATWTRSTR